MISTSNHSVKLFLVLVAGQIIENPPCGVSEFFLDARQSIDPCKLFIVEKYIYWCVIQVYALYIYYNISINIYIQYCNILQFQVLFMTRLFNDFPYSFLWLVNTLLHSQIFYCTMIARKATQNVR